MISWIFDLSNELRIQCHQSFNEPLLASIEEMFLDLIITSYICERFEDGNVGLIVTVFENTTLEWCCIIPN